MKKMTDDEAQDGAEQMAEMAQRAAEAAHELIGSIIDASKLTEYRKIGAAITAINALYAGILDGVADGKIRDEGQGMLVVGLFNHHCARPLAKIAKRVKRDLEK